MTLTWTHDETAADDTLAGGTQGQPCATDADRRRDERVTAWQRQLAVAVAVLAFDRLVGEHSGVGDDLADAGGGDRDAGDTGLRLGRFKVGAVADAAVLGLAGGTFGLGTADRHATIHPPRPWSHSRIVRGND